MRTVIIIAIGLAILAAFVLLPRLAGRPEWSAVGAKLFIALWLVAAVVNLWIGVRRAGYTVLEELPIFLLIFALPAALAAHVWWKSG
jgi:hypothetical protein